MSLINFTGMRNSLMKHLYRLEQNRKCAEQKGYTLSEIDRLDKDIEEKQNKLKEVMKIIEKQERKHRYDMQTCAKFKQLLDRLGLKLNGFTPLAGIDIAECLLAGYEKKGHSFYKLLHSEDPTQQKNAEKDVRILKRFIKFCERAQLNK